MSEDKYAGKKKYLHKQKFRNQVPSKIKLHENESESHSRILDRNWDRYEEPEPQPFEVEYATSRDFKFLSENPASQGGYFQFKKDKHFLPKGDAKFELDSLFELNMNLINKSLLTIPFYERLNIEKDIFNDNQLRTMAKTAEEYTEKFKLFLENKNVDVSPCTNSETVEMVEDKKSNSNSSLLQQISETCDNIDKMVLNKDEETEKLETWLDDILE